MAALAAAAAAEIKSVSAKDCTTIPCMGLFNCIQEGSRRGIICGSCGKAPKGEQRFCENPDKKTLATAAAAAQRRGERAAAEAGGAAGSAAGGAAGDTSTMILHNTMRATINELTKTWYIHARGGRGGILQLSNLNSNNGPGAAEVRELRALNPQELHMHIFRDTRTHNLHFSLKIITNDGAVLHAGWPSRSTPWESFQSGRRRQNIQESNQHTADLLQTLYNTLSSARGPLVRDPLNFQAGGRRTQRKRKTRRRKRKRKTRRRKRKRKTRRRKRKRETRRRKRKKT